MGFVQCLFASCGISQFCISANEQNNKKEHVRNCEKFFTHKAILGSESLVFSLFFYCRFLIFFYENVRVN